MLQLNSPLKSLFILALCLLPILFTSCGDDDDISNNERINNELEGDWDVESYTADGEELIGSFVTSFQMEYTKEGPEEGEAEWTIIFFDGSTSFAEGDYEIQNDGREIDFDGDDLDIDIDGDELELSGIIEGERVEIQAERD